LLKLLLKDALLAFSQIQTVLVGCCSQLAHGVDDTAILCRTQVLSVCASAFQ
jgi:hypothetical protein